MDILATSQRIRLRLLQKSVCDKIEIPFQRSICVTLIKTNDSAKKHLQGNYTKFLKNVHAEQAAKLQAKNQHECDLLEDIR